MKFELKVTDENNNSKKIKLLTTQDWKQLVGDLKQMNGINVLDEICRFLMDETKRELNIHLDIEKGKFKR